MLCPLKQSIFFCFYSKKQWWCCWMMHDEFQWECVGEEIKLKTSNVNGLSSTRGFSPSYLEQVTALSWPHADGVPKNLCHERRKNDCWMDEKMGFGLADPLSGTSDTTMALLFPSQCMLQPADNPLWLPATYAKHTLSPRGLGPCSFLIACPAVPVISVESRTTGLMKYFLQLGGCSMTTCTMRVYF